ncbi:MAG TPA: CAP domain-containing protein [Pyrinomonadaceae bacterium]|nr:CAP domain-containing protein [Pyrinomonadaceae bacterium]
MRSPNVARLGLLSLTALTLLAMLSSSQSVYAQPSEARPVARLVSTSADSSIPRGIVDVRTPANERTSFPSLDDANSIERRAFAQTNAVRAQHGLQPFVWDPELCRLARNHSANMARTGLFSHATPEGMRLKERAHAAGIRYQVIAENIAYNMGYDDPGAFAVERWMISPSHRANILYAGFTSMAVGTFVAADGSVFLTQTFITR